MPRIVLVRHGEAEGDAAGRFTGRSDVPLTEAGVAQIVALETRVADLDITAVLTSPLQRARQAADLLGRTLDLEPAAVEGLTDLDAGRWTGRTLDDLAHADPAVYAAWLDHPETVEFPDGESLPDLRERITAAMAEILDAYPEDANLLVVTHEHPARQVLTLLLGLGPERHWDIAVDAASLSVFERRSEHFFLTLLNETCHLEHTGEAHVVLPGE